MSKEIYISSTPHETRLAIVENDALTEIYYERENEYTLAGSIYNGRVTRVLPGMQSSFVDVGLERDAFLYITDFMEEAGDSADFESTHGGGAEPGAAKVGTRPELGRGDGRRDRKGNERAFSNPDSNEAPTELVSMPAADSSEGERSGQRDRSGRGGRGRRGRRDGRPDRERSDIAGPENAAVGTASVTEPSGSSWDDGQPDFSGRSTSGANEGQGARNETPEDVGEGAPGADGSRRWRGRRGRRRGRGPGQAAPGQEGQDGLGTTDAGSSAAEDVEVPRQNDSEERGFTFDGSAAPEPPTRDQSDEAPAQSRPAPRVSTEASQAGTEQHGRSDAGNQRDRNRGGRDARGGGRRDDRPQRVPRGFEPRKNLYGVENSPAEATDSSEAEAVPERIILPGESLSKYRQGGEERAPAAQATDMAATPPTTFKLAAGWDGGATLPGESLSRHRGGEVRRSADTDPRDDSRVGRPGRDDRNSRGDNRDRSGRGDRNERGDNGQRPGRDERRNSDIAQPVVREQIHPVAAAMQTEKVESGDLGHTQPTSEQALATHESLETAGAQATHPSGVHATPAVVVESTPVVHAEAAPVQEPAGQVVASDVPPAVEAEHDPSAASASYRFDPAPPSEYRLSPAPREVEGSGGLATEEAPDLAHEPVPSHTPDPTEHATTTIEATGNMHSEPTTGVPPPPMPDPDMAEPTAPILHETAVVLPAEQESGGEFAPGAGDLEEELIEDEDLDTATLEAGADEGFDDLEEETLEGGADLGTMLREMTIDHMVRPEARAGEDGNGDFAEEDFEEGVEEEASHPGLVEEEEDDEPEQHLETSQAASQGENGMSPLTGNQEPRRDRREGDGRDRDGRRSGRDAGRRGDRDRRGSDRDRGMDRARRTGGSGDRGPGRGRAMQSVNLPAISDLLKPGQEILVQIAKEPIAKKGARITSHIALPGRFLVFMPTVSHTGVSRKIESDGERQRLKRILLSEKGEAAGGFIVRTAASGASEEELRSDLRFLLNLWNDIKQRSESSKSPALIYHDLNLVERVLRDQVTDTFSAIWVDTEGDYERILKFLQRFQPSLIRRVKLYSKETPLFEQFGITEEINKALRSKVWLKSGGSIVINQTEALVAIDINTGKFVGKTARLEDTIVKTNLDAIPEIVRQIRLRDLGGIIILDFIDMDERKNRNRVMAALEEELKTDRAPSKVLQFNDFGLVAITRKRVKQSLERTLSTPCTVCVGTGMVKSPITVCNDIYIEMRKMHKHLDRGDVMLRVHPEVVKQLKVAGGRWLQEMEEMVGKTILVKSDPSLHPEQFDIH